MRAALAGVLLFAVAACGPLTPPVTDAGTTGGGTAATGGGVGVGGGANTGGGSAVGGGTATGGGVASGGGTATGGGSASDGGDGTWDFLRVNLNPAPTSSSNVIGFAETDAGVFAMTSSGRVFLSSNGPFQEFVNVGGFMNDFDMSPNGHFYATRTTTFMHCGTNCATAASWVELQYNFTGSMIALCVVSDSLVFAVGGDGQNNNVAARWDGVSLAATSTIGGSNPHDCFRVSNGDFVVPSQDSIVRYVPSLDGWTNDPFVGNWLGGGSTPSGDWVSARGPTFARRQGGNWTPVGPSSTAIATARAIVGVSPTLTFGFGGGGTSDGQCGYTFDGTTWAPMPNDIPAMNQATTAMRASNGNIYVGGNDANGSPCVVVGIRR